MTEQKSTMTQTETGGTTWVVERTFSAPRQLVWDAWTDPRQLEKWWGPRGWTTTVYKLDLQPGGVWHYCMREDGGEAESWGLGTYREITPISRLSYTDNFADKDGNINAEMPTINIEMEFVDEGSRTRLVSSTYFPSSEMFETLKEMGMEQGMTETWDRLEEHVSALA